MTGPPPTSADADVDPAPDGSSPGSTDAARSDRSATADSAEGTGTPGGQALPARVRQFVGRPWVRAVATGLVLAFSLPPWGWWPLGFVAMAMLDRLLADTRARDRFSRGTLVGLALFAPTMVWITQLSSPGYVIVVLVFSVLGGAFATLVPPGTGRRPALIGVWALSESLRIAWPFGGVPLSLVAVGQVGGPLAGIARVGGVLLIAIATVTVGVALSAAVARQIRPAAIAAASVAALILLAAVAPSGENTGTRLDIAFVQGGGEQGTRAINSDSRKVFERHLEASAQVPDDMDLVLWPENVVDTDFDVQDAKEGRELQALARRLDAPVLVGTVEGVDDTNFRNSQQVVGADGEWGDRYVKVQRVPFGEFVPFRSLIEKVAPDTLARRDATISTQSGLMRTDVAPIATVISWEVFFGHRARSAVRAGGELLYNPTNGSTYTGTFVQTQQVAMSRLRAIETGRWEVQVAPTGFSAFVGPDGTVYQRTGTSEQAVRVRRDVPLRTGETPYVRYGDFPPRLLALGLLAAGWALHLRGRRHRPEPAR